MWFIPLILFGGSMLAGVINAVAGGGSLLVYPLLLSLGLPPIIANASTGVVVLPGTLSSAYGYRQQIGKLPRRYYFVLLPCMLGGLIGAWALRHTSNHTFAQIVPWFILLGVGLIAIQPSLVKWIRQRRGHRRRNLLRVTVALAGAGFLLSIYGGYFGAGYSIVLLAFLGFTELTDIHEMNGYKNLVSAAVNITSTSYLIYHGLVRWEVLPVLLLGNLIGGWVGANYSTHLPKRVIHTIIIVIGLVVAAVLFWRG